MFLLARLGNLASGKRVNGRDRPRAKARGSRKVTRKRLWYQQGLLAMQVLHPLLQGLLPQP